MSDLSQFLQPLAVGSRVQNITGDLSSAAAAGGYSAWVQSVTGQTPAVQDIGDGRASIVLTQQQNIAMQKWLDKQVGSIFQPPAQKPVVEYNIGAYMTPWAMKYLIPAGIGLFTLGWIAAYYLQKG